MKGPPEKQLEDDDLEAHSVTQDFARLCSLVETAFSGLGALDKKHGDLLMYLRMAKLMDLPSIVEHLPPALATLEELITSEADASYTLSKELLQEGRKLLAGVNIEVLRGVCGVIGELFTLGAYYGWPTAREHSLLTRECFFYLEQGPQPAAAKVAALERLEVALLSACQLFEGFMARDNYDPRYEDFDPILSACRELLDRLEVEKLLKSA